MKKHGLFLIMMVLAFCATFSCKKEEDNHQERWMIANMNALNAIKSNPEYKELKSPGNEGSIYYKVLKAGDGKDSIRYTSSVTCYYKGWLVADYPLYNIKAGDKFDQKLFDDGPPYYTNLTNVITGWRTALQHMVQGDKWEIWVPYQLGYGRKKQGDPPSMIPGYSTLVFELEVMKVYGVNDL